jgi:drug/metabolite transporter (DMT)-like permease
MVPAVLLLGRVWPANLTWVGALAALELGLLGTGLAYILYYWLIQRLGAVRTTLVTYIIPVVGLVLGALFLQEALHFWALGGLLLIALGIWIVNQRPR